MQETIKPLSLSLKLDFGRDVGILRKIVFSENNNLEIFFNCRTNGFYKELKFTYFGVLAYNVTILDLYKYNFSNDISNFNEVEKSHWIQELEKYNTDGIDFIGIKHFRIALYDQIIDIVAKDYNLMNLD